MTTVAKPKEALKYYNYSKLLSYNATYNICVGGRGLGKTFGAKKIVIKDAIDSYLAGNEETINQFIYLRRYKPEIRLAKDTFFADIYRLFPDWDFRVNNAVAQFDSVDNRILGQKRPWKTFGYFLPLVTSQHFKSVAFPNVKTIIYDEFIIETGMIRYLPNETTVFNNFYSTVDRYKDKTRVFFLANSVSITNPYFIDWELNPRDSDKNGIVKKYKGFVVAHFVESKEFNTQAYDTVFGQFIKGTDYAAYAVENEFSDNGESMLRPKGSHADYMFTLETKFSTFSVWYDMRTDLYYCQSSRPKEEIFFTLVPEKMDNHKKLMVWQDRPLSSLRGHFRRGLVWFDKPLTRNSFIEIFKQR